ncbi:MAG: hypothetical protein LUQ38_00385 [Methanotrichaceae archaeon]|nr:hypothetical protein [Methanotrichaceae archaeon]
MDHQQFGLAHFVAKRALWAYLHSRSFILVTDPVEVDNLVLDGESVLFGECSSASSLFTPGHSPGSLSLYFPNEKALFCGDAIPLKGDVPNYDSYSLTLSSLEKLEKLTSIECSSLLGMIHYLIRPPCMNCSMRARII